MNLSWQPPKDWLVITTIDAHTAGEPLRVITEGFPEIHGKTILEKRRYLRENLDHLRTAILWEPRGHADMYGCIVTPPVSPEADFGVLFLHNEGYSTMCGHGIIALTKIVLETGMLTMTDPVTTVKIDTPAGLVTANASIENEEVTSVNFHNVPSFVLVQDESVDVPGIGTVQYDIAFGGAFYAFVQAEEIGISCTPENVPLLIESGMAIKRAIMEMRLIHHPFEEDLNFLYGTIFIAPPMGEEADSRNVCIFAEGEVDRSPTGTGVSARLALHYKQGEIGIDDLMVVESIIGSKFKGRIVDTTNYGSYDAVIPQVEGTAHITGQNRFVIDPKDPFQYGFILR